MKESVGLIRKMVNIIRLATKLVKEILMNVYPNEKFIIQYKEPKWRNCYASTGDKIIIKINDKDKKEEIESLLKINTKGIRIGHGFSKSTGGLILNINTKQYEETDVEFIIIE